MNKPFVSNVDRHPTRYKFEVYMLDGTKKPDLKRSFLRRMLVNIEDMRIITEDMLIWRVIVDTTEIVPSVNGIADCMVSFQAFHDGERIAVIRPYNKDHNNG